MPIYEYQCKECGHVFEEWQKNFDEQDIPCPVCGGSTHRLISNTSFVLKGSGWYVTDYCSRSSANNGGGKTSNTSSKNNSSGKSCSISSGGSAKS
ncbi:putative regulatory protein, FmdB family [Desulfonauticus submarinus]|uniref:Putative regulatory protein, FmdB family n=1 Tax=Desulfonauticus submarinus TaxID=206665 RepID=A0A1H0BHE0_9BACT|nr:zinc ribbon domain-containing protein [Desulfonauticus submarinus]SDN45051.1 putative regulatory protein, FmdB family [Desulfonauticus submarinus]